VRESLKMILSYLVSRIENIGTAVSIASNTPLIIGNLASKVCSTVGNTFAIAVPSLRSIYETYKKNNEFKTKHEENKENISDIAKDGKSQISTNFINKKLNALVESKNRIKNINYILNTTALLLTVTLDALIINAMTKNETEALSDLKEFQWFNLITAMAIFTQYPFHALTVREMSKPKLLSEKIDTPEKKKFLKSKFFELRNLRNRISTDDGSDEAKKLLITDEDVREKEEEILSILFSFGEKKI
jgi:hypothetical protein